ncbi:MAG TPA: GntR family transcriptional regulator [Streptosporangiaceae bacterium]|jgi:GntR family transcriptional regulator|nr:GntR family transcriptional regulator [Streptosporangiaceae bacterium]
MADPLYRRIADDLRQEIESGRLPPDSQLPTEDDLRKQFGASRNTIRDAVRSLITLGLVETRPGQGTFVVGGIDPLVTTLSGDLATGLVGGEGATYLSEVSEQHRRPTSVGPRIELKTAAGEVAARLRVPESTPLVSRHEQRFIDDTPWSLQTSFYPRSFAMRGAPRLLDDENIEQGAVKYLEETLGIKQVGYRDWITMRAPDFNEIAFFRLPPDGRVPVFEIFRTGFDQTGTPLRVTVTVFPADRNQFIVDVGKVPAPQYKLTTEQNVTKENQVPGL